MTTAPRVATSATSSPALSSAANPASMPVKMAAVLTPPVVTTAAVETALSNVVLPRTLGTKATAALHRAKTPVKTVLVKAVAGKTVVVTTAMPPALPLAAQRVTSSPVVLSSLVPATSNRMLLAKALQANVVAPAC